MSIKKYKTITALLTVFCSINYEHVESMRKGKPVEYRVIECNGSRVMEVISTRKRRYPKTRTARFRLPIAPGPLLQMPRLLPVDGLPTQMEDTATQVAFSTDIFDDAWKDLFTSAPPLL